MKTFRDFLKEDVMPTAQVADGSLDIEKPAVRAAINAAIAGVTSQPAVTPYVVYNRLSKLLAQYHIILPRKFLEGDKGVEVFELKQFGHRMGMTDGGEFVNETPSTHYLFLQYGILSPFGITYAKPVVGGMFKVAARLVDKEELDKLLDMAEVTMSEEAEVRQNAAKARAPREEMHDITSDEKKKGNKEAVSDSEKGLNEVSLGKLVAYKNKADKSFTDSFGVKGDKEKKTVEKRLHGMSLAHKKITGKAKVGTSAPKHPYMEEETLDETHADNIRRKYREKEDSNDHTGNVHLLTRVFGSKKERETSKGLLQKRNKQGYVTGSDSEKGYNMTKNYARRMEKLKEDGDLKDACWKGYTAKGLKKKGGKMVPNCVPVEEENLAEKAPPGAKFERMVKHIKKGYSKDGLTTKEKSIAYATAWKAKKKETSEE